MKKLSMLLFVILFCQSLTILAQNDSLVYRTMRDISYRNAADAELTDYMKERCKLDLYYPENKEGFATLVFFHPGGLKEGNKFIHESLKNKGVAIAAVNYRLSPQAKCPAYIDDAAASVAWIFNNIAEYGGNPDLIIVTGHSAGGYLTSMIGLDKRWLGKYDIDADRIAGLIALSGHTITHFTVREELGIVGTQPVIDEYAPLFHVRPDAPPLILITGDRELELLGRYEENAYLWRMMKVAGHDNTELFELQGYDHSGMAFASVGLLFDKVNKIVESKKQNE